MEHLDVHEGKETDKLIETGPITQSADSFWAQVAGRKYRLLVITFLSCGCDV